MSFPARELPFIVQKPVVTAQNPFNLTFRQEPSGKEPNKTVSNLASDIYILIADERQKNSSFSQAIDQKLSSLLLKYFLENEQKNFLVPELEN